MEVKEWFNSLFRKIEPKEKALTAEEAYFKTKYGVYRTVEQRIKDNQKNIKELIKSKVTPLDDELKPYVNDIFKPFVENGFKVINLSDKVEEINDELVFLISWYKNDFGEVVKSNTKNK